MAGSCPDCGTLAVPTSEVHSKRRVYACGNDECGLHFIHLYGKLIRLRYEPWAKPKQHLWKDNTLDHTS